MESKPQNAEYDLPQELIQPDLIFFTEDAPKPCEGRLPRCLWYGPRTIHRQRLREIGIAFLFEGVD